MRYLSVCSGIEAASVAWHGLGWQPVAFAEIEKFPAQVLAHHYPDVPNFGDMTKFQEWPNESIDLLVGGTPCQSFSVAGLRRGMADPRGNLALTYLAIADRYKPRWIVWENVPGVLSSAGGRDFGSFLGALAQLGYGFAYRVLDARFFGVAQRRRRVFVVGYLGDWRRAAAVLFESPSGRRDTPSRREKRQSVAPTVVSGPPFSRTGNARVEADALVARMVAFGEYVDDGTASAMKARDYKDATDLVAHAFTTGSIGTYRDGIGTLRANGGDIGGGSENLITQSVAQPIHYRKSRRAQSTEDHETWVEDDATNTLNCFDVGDVRAVDVIAQPITFGAQMSTPQTDVDLVQTLQAKNPMAVAQPVAFHVDAQPDQMNFSSETTASLTCSQHAGVQMGMAVRRLTPTECERLQGFPDGYTNIKDNCPDGPRYKALGNSMAVPVMRWIGERIQTIEGLTTVLPYSP